MLSNYFQVVNLVGQDKTRLMLCTDLHCNKDIQMQSTFRYVQGETGDITESRLHSYIIVSFNAEPY